MLRDFESVYDDFVDTRRYRVNLLVLVSTKRWYILRSYLHKVRPTVWVCLTILYV